MGWDGTLWAIDTSGVPHLFNQNDDAWYVYGRGIDAIAWGLDEPGDPLVFRGDEYTANGAAPTTIAETWPGLPGSFQLGVDGAANVNGSLYLFKAGQYALADANAKAITAVAMETLTGWPHTDTWRHGLVDAVGSSSDAASSSITLFRGDEFLVVDMASKEVTRGPFPLSSRYAGDLLAVMQQGIDAVTFTGSDTRVSQGPVQWLSDDDTTCSAHYHAWRSEWFHTLAHSPTGIIGDLLAADVDGTTVYRHDGDDWRQLQPPVGGYTLTSASVGVDETVFAIASRSEVYALDSGQWYHVASWQGSLDQISVGSRDHIYVLDDQKRIHRLDGSSFTPVDAGVDATYMAVTSDGSIWHCNRGDPQAYRHIIAAPVPSAALSLPEDVTSVVATAATGFGISHVLVENETGRSVQRFDSPYLMKTAGAYQSAFGRQVSVGAGCLFFSYLDPDDDCVYHACIDAHSGEQRWRTLVKDNKDTNVTVADFKESVFDPQFQVIYVPLDDDVVALDVQHGAEVWRYTNRFGPIVTRPSVHGTVLCVVTDLGFVLTFDTARAHRSALQNEAVTPLWMWKSPPNFGGTLAPQPPTITPDAIYLAIWNRVTGPGPEHIGLLLVKLRTGNLAKGEQRQVWATPKEAVGDRYPIEELAYVRNVQPVLFPSVALPSGPGETTADMIIVGWNRTVQQFDAADGSASFSYELKDDEQITSGLAVDRVSSDGVPSYSVPVCVFGTNAGEISAVQLGPEASGPVWNTPFAPTKDVTQPITSTPFLRQREKTTPVAWFGLNGTTTLWGYDTASTDASVQVDVGATCVSTMVPSTNDVVYVGGYSDRAGTVAQYYAIRLPDAPFQDFVIESQLMEDRDTDPKTKQLTQLTRYQTHITVVDGQKAARPSQMIKLWAQSRDQVAVDIDGVTHQISASTPAMFQMDGSGSMTVVSDAEDLTAVPLRLWAEFMDPHERIVIYPDRELHQRLTAPVAVAPPSGDYDASAEDASAEIDPTIVNLSTATTFDRKTKLCDTQTQATSTKQAVTRAWGAVQQRYGVAVARAHAPAPGHGRADRPRPNRRRRPTTRPLPTGVQRRPSARPVPSGWRHAGATPTLPADLPAAAGAEQRYVAYADLEGFAYFAKDTPAARDAAIVSPAGFTLDEADGFTAQSVADSAAAVDGLTEQPVSQTLVGAHDVGSFFSSLWDKIKKLGRDIKKVVVSIGRDIYIGLQYIEAKATKVIRAVIRTVEDVASVVGAFFVKLGKMLENIVEALTVLFHFDKIKDTATWIAKDLFGDFTSDMTNNIDAMVNTFDTHIEDLENNIDAAFQSLIDKLDPPSGALAASGSISGMPGMGTTAHTAFAVAPKNSKETKKSHAVQCTWAAHKVRHHYKQATTNGDGVGASDPFGQAIIDTLGAIASDEGLRKALDEARAQFHRKLRIASPDDLLRAAAADLLEAIKVVVVGAFAVVKKFVDGVAKAAIGAFAGLDNELHIPVIEQLWRAVTGTKLSFVNVVAFIVAIPITIIYRILEGAWPPVGDDQLGADVQAEKRVAGLVGGILLFFAGLFTAAIDAIIATGDQLMPGIVAKVCLVITLMVQAGVNESKLAVIGNDVSIVFTGLSFLSAIITGLAFSIKAEGVPQILTVCNVLLQAVAVITAVVAFLNKKMPWEGLAVTAIAAFAVFVNPLKFAPNGLVRLIAPVADLAFRAGAGGFAITATVAHW